MWRSKKNIKVSDQHQHCLPLMQQFLDMSAGGKMDIQILLQVWEGHRCPNISFKFYCKYGKDIGVPIFWNYTVTWGDI